MPVLNIIIRLDRLLQIFVILSFSSFLDSFEIMHYELLLCLINAGTEPIWGLHVQPVDVVLLLKALLCLSLGIYQSVEEADGRGLSVPHLMELLLGHGYLHETLGWA